MLTTEMLDGFVGCADTSTLHDVLVGHSLIGTEVGDRVLAAVQNDTPRYHALVGALRRSGNWDAAA